MKVLVDGDVIAYRCAFSAQSKGLDEEEALDLVDGLLDEIRFATSSSEDEIWIFLTGKGNFRHDISKTYKANRKDSERPEHLSAIRDHMIKNWSAAVSQDQEADDMIATMASEFGYDCIIASTDKDFKQIPCRHYNTMKGEWSFVSPEEATRNFYTQILTGDRSDNIAGIYGIGPKKAEGFLGHLTTEEQMYDKVLELYDGNADLVLETARLLWLRRKEGEMWLPPGQRQE